MWVEWGGKKMYLDVKLKGSPVFDGVSVGQIWRAHGGAELSIEYAL
jgi:hypothetical protein